MTTDLTTDVTVDTVVAPAPDVHVVTLDDEKVVFVPGPATLHHLDAIGALVWDCLTPPAAAGAISRDLADAFGADSAQVERDVLALLSQLVTAGALGVVADLTPDA